MLFERIKLDNGTKGVYDVTLLVVLWVIIIAFQFVGFCSFESRMDRIEDRMDRLIEIHTSEEVR